MAGTKAVTEALIAKIRKYPCAITWGDDVIAPTEGAPSLGFEASLYDSTCQEAGGDVVASWITAKLCKIGIVSKDIAKAIELLDAFKVGDNIFASGKKKALTIAPIIAGEIATDGALVFGTAYLIPTGSGKVGGGEDHSMGLEFVAKPNENGLLLGTVAPTEGG